MSQQCTPASKQLFFKAANAAAAREETSQTPIQQKHDQGRKIDFVALRSQELRQEGKAELLEQASHFFF